MMKCINCGLPLSPTSTRKDCPRCHTSLVPGSKSAAPSASQQDGNSLGEAQKSTSGTYSLSFGQGVPGKVLSGEQTIGNPQREHGQPRNFTQGETPLQTQLASQVSSFPTQTKSDSPLPPVAQTPFPQPGQMLQPHRTPPPLPITYPPDMVPSPLEAAVHNSGALHALPTLTKSAVHSIPSRAIRPRKRQGSNLGFIIAGLCVITGGLILAFVYYAAMDLPSTNTTNVSTGTLEAARKAFPSPTTILLSPTVIPSPTTATYPGQQYIDNVRMASIINTTTAQPLQTTTTFKINRKVYVAFSIHPNGRNGAICLFWYLNNRIIAQYPFGVAANAQAGYSYATYTGPGMAYVDIYWASTTACSDKILAQHVSFTVTK